YEVFGGDFFGELDEVGHFFGAGRAPGGPHGEDDALSFEFAEGEGVAVEGGDGEIGAADALPDIERGLVFELGHHGHDVVNVEPGVEAEETKADEEADNGETYPPPGHDAGVVCAAEVDDAEDEADD